MNLKNMTDDVLLFETRKLVQTERRLLSDILRHLREIERRRLYSTLKCSSLFEYATRELGYSEDQACRRIQAMRLLKDLPEVEAHLNTGALTLTHLGMAQSLFKKEEKIAEKSFSREEKLQVLASLASTSKRDAEKILLGVASSAEFVLPTEKIRAISPSEVEIRFTAKAHLLDKIETLKGLLAHRHPHLQISELIDLLCDLGLKAWSPAAIASHQGKVRTIEDAQTALEPAHPMKQPAPARKFLSKSDLRRAVWRNAHGRCENCSSRYALEIDHRLPRALGGSDTPENLRLLCRSCNQRAAIEHLGQQHMEQYLSG